MEEAVKGGVYGIMEEAVKGRGNWALTANI